MKILDKLRELLSGITEEMTIEEVRPVVADAVDALESADSDIDALVTRVGELEADIELKNAEIDKLRTENGRLFRERIAHIEKSDEAEAEAVDEEMSAEELRELFNSMP